jgi:signal transduction histidine kinase
MLITSARMLTVSAILTWAAIVLSEYFQQRGIYRTAFLLLAAIFISTFLWLELPAQRAQKGWSLSLVVLTLSCAFAVQLGGFGITPALYVIVAAKLFDRLPARQYWLVLAGLNAALLLRLALDANWIWALSAFAAYAGFQIFGAMMTASTSALNLANIQLQARNTELISTRALLSESARAQERLRLSRELHDVCGHKLTALKLMLRHQPGRDLPAADRALCQQLADELLQEIRAVVAQLRAHDGIDLAETLRQLGAQWRAHQVSVSIENGARAPSVAQAQSLLRTAQEALTNAANHANAKQVQIRLQQVETGLMLSVQDDGRGNPTLKFGNGLTGMRERIEELGGTLSVRSSATGTTVQAIFPGLQT